MIDEDVVGKAYDARLMRRLLGYLRPYRLNAALALVAIIAICTSGVVSIFGDVFRLVGIMIVMLSMNWRLALVAFAVLPLIVLVTQWFRRHVRESYRTVRRLIARINAYLQEHITGMGTVQLFRREARAYRTFEGINQDHRVANEIGRAHV